MSGISGKDTLRARPARKSPLRALVLLGFAVPVFYIVWLVSYRPAGAGGRPVQGPGKLGAPAWQGPDANGGHAASGTGGDPRWLGQEDRDAAVEPRAQEMRRRSDGKEGWIVTPWESSPPWPWQKIKDRAWQELGILGICAPFEDDFYTRSTMKGLFWEFKNAGMLMFGIASYEDFPGEIVNPADSRHVGADMPEIIRSMDFWLHCFQDPESFGLPPGVPRLLLSESDFVDFERDDGGGRLKPKSPPPDKRWDLVYVNRGGAWNDYNRNWTVAEPSLLRLAKELNFEIATIDRMPSAAAMSAAGLTTKQRSGITKHASLPWNRYLELVETARMVFVPNVHDASPRVISEAMSLGVPVLMNQNILGGWKYLKDAPSPKRGGVFFEDERDVVQRARELLAGVEEGSVDARAAVMSGWGYQIASARLKAFLEEVVGEERLAEVHALAVSHHLRPGRRSLHSWAPLPPHSEDPGHEAAAHHSAADPAARGLGGLGHVVVSRVRGLQEHWPPGEAPEVISSAGAFLRFSGLRRWLREEGAAAGPDVRAFVEETIRGFGVSPEG